MDERDFFDEKESKKPHTLNCPHCRQANEYELAWLVRTKKKQLPPRADERDRAKFAKAQSYMVRRDDMVACKNMRCRKRFEVAGGGSLTAARPRRYKPPHNVSHHGNQVEASQVAVPGDKIAKEDADPADVKNGARPRQGLSTDP